MGKAEITGSGLASLTHFSGFYGVGPISCCLVCDPPVMRTGNFDPSVRVC